MSDPEDFLARWSRRKHDAGQAPQSPGETGSEAPVPERAAAAPIEEPTLDLSALPPIDEITATTDIRAYLAPGVPAELARAALRRAWVADPTIRDFIGIAENQWDFNDPHGVPGFGRLDDAVRLVARLLGDEGGRAVPLANSPAPATPQLSSPGPNVTSVPDAPVAKGESASAADGEPWSLVQGGTNISAANTSAANTSAAPPIAAPQQPDWTQSEYAPVPRRHGGALPK